MKITCLALEPDGGLQAEAETTSLAAWRAGAGPYWIDLSGGRPEDARDWLADLGLDPALLELMQIGDAETRVLPLVESVFFAYSVPTDDDTGTKARFSCLCLDRLVITIHERPASVPLIDHVPLAKLGLQEGSVAGVVCGLAHVQSMRLRRDVVGLRGEGDALVLRMDSDPEAVPPDQILSLKRRVLALGGLVDEQLAVLEALTARRTPPLPLGHHTESIQIAIGITRATERDIDRLDRRLSDLQRRYETAQQDRTNHRLGLLTILSAIFMPLTLIVGLYGMNFDVMPELHFRFGYPITLGVMALTAGGLYWYFRSRGWLK